MHRVIALAIVVAFCISFGGRTLHGQSLAVASTSNPDTIERLGYPTNYIATPANNGFLVDSYTWSVYDTSVIPYQPGSMSLA